MGHVFVRLSGHGLRLVPYWPYRFERIPAGADTLAVTRGTEHGPVRTTVGPGAADAGTPGPTVVDVAPGPEHRHWLIETTGFTARWPAGFALESPDDPGDPTLFLLLGPDGAMIWPQGPVPADRLAAPDALVGPGQTIQARRRIGRLDVVELSYRHDGEPWWQGHWMVPADTGRVLLISAQAPVDRAIGTRAAAEELADSVTAPEPT